LATVAKGILMIWMAGVLWGALRYAPPARGLGETARVIFFHVPVAWISVLAFCTSLYHSVMVLRTGREENDIGAEASARLGLWFCVLATISGALFAKSAWNMYWNWDPRETSIVVLLMIYMAYFGLRSALPDPDRRKRLAAVYAILAFFIMLFLVFVVPRMYMSLHPDTVINWKMENKIADSTIRLVLFASVIGFTGIYAWMYNLSVRIERLVRRKEGADV